MVCFFLLNLIQSKTYLFLFFKDDKEMSTSDWMLSVVNKLSDNAVDKSNSNSVLKQVKAKSKDLYDTWSELQV